MYKKYYCPQFILLILCLGLFSGISLPIQAYTKNNDQLLPENNNHLLCLSWGDIWKRLRRRKAKRGSRRPDENKEFFCMIVPGKLKDADNSKQTLEVWNTQPLFLWKDNKNKIRRIEVFHIRSNQVVWRSKTLKPGTNRVLYDGKPLKPGEAYSWREAISPEQLPSKQSFRIMSAAERNNISKGLNQLKPKGASKDKMILARVDYFADKQLWSDVLREIYSVKNPSPELQQKIKQIQSHDFCSPKKNEQKFGLVSWK